MRQELFLGWSIPFAMLFAFYSCSHEMDSNLESAVEEAVDLRLDQDSALTRSDLWEEEEESALEWAEDKVSALIPHVGCVNLNLFQT